MKNEFETWIDDNGIDDIARLLKVTYTTVKGWRDRVCYPKVEHMKRIKKATKGRVDYHHIIDRPVYTRRELLTFKNVNVG